MGAPWGPMGTPWGPWAPWGPGRPGGRGRAGPRASAAAGGQVLGPVGAKTVFYYIRAGVLSEGAKIAVRARACRGKRRTRAAGGGDCTSGQIEPREWHLGGCAGQPAAVSLSATGEVAGAAMPFGAERALLNALVPAEAAPEADEPVVRLVVLVDGWHGVWAHGDFE